MMKKALSTITSIALTVGFGLIATSSAQASVSIGDGTCDLAGSGTSSDKYLIGDKLDLHEIEEDCVDESGTFHFKQTANIDLGGIHHDEIDSADGHIIYDGSGFTISGIANLENEHEHGLFGDVENLTVSNLNLEATTILGSLDESAAEVGTLAGQVDNDLTVTNVNVLVGSFESGGESGALVGEVDGAAIVTDATVYVYDMNFAEDEMALVIGEVGGAASFTRVSAVAVYHQFPSSDEKSTFGIGIGGLVGDADAFYVEQAYVDFGKRRIGATDPKSASWFGGLIGDSNDEAGDSYIRNSEVLAEVQAVEIFGGLIGSYYTEVASATLEISDVVVSVQATQSLEDKEANYYWGGLIGKIEGDGTTVAVSVDDAVVSARFTDEFPAQVEGITETSSSITSEVLTISSGSHGLTSGQKIFISGMTDGVETNTGAATLINGEQTVDQVLSTSEFTIDLSGTGIANDAALGDGDASYVVYQGPEMDVNSMVGDETSTTLTFTDTYLDITAWDNSDFPNLKTTETKYSSGGITELTATQMRTKSNFAFAAEIGDPGADYETFDFEMCSTSIHVAFNPGPCDDPSERTFSSVRGTYSVGSAITPITVTNSTNGRDDVLLYEIDPALPAGLAIDRANGTISGTPRESTPSTNYQIRTKNTSERHTGVSGYSQSSITFATAMPDQSSSSGSYTGPLLLGFSQRTVSNCSPTTITVTGERLSGISEIKINGGVVDFQLLSTGALNIVIPQLPAGTYDFKIKGSVVGNLTHLDAITVLDTCTVHLQDPSGEYAAEDKVARLIAKAVNYDLLCTPNSEIPMIGSEFALMKG